ncbi:hypothetical protein OS11_09830 [Dickeya oryzae]
MNAAPRVANRESGESLVKVGAVAGNVPLYVRLFDDIVADEGWQRRQTDELVGLVKRQVDAVYTDTMEELVRVGEGLQRGVPGQRQQVVFAL